MRLTIVSNEIEAEVLCGLLRENGIRCNYTKSNMAAAISAASGGFSMDGPTEVFVGPDDLEAAKKVLEQR